MELKFLLSLLLLMMMSFKITQVAEAQSLCLSQYALANQACSLLHIPASALLSENNNQVEFRGTKGSNCSDGSSRHSRRSSSTAAASVSPERKHGHHHHHHGGDHHENPEDTACCRRLKGIDDVCICQVLARLPKFITKPKHKLTLSPVPGCEITYECDTA